MKQLQLYHVVQLHRQQYHEDGQREYADAHDTTAKAQSGKELTVATYAEKARDGTQVYEYGEHEPHGYENGAPCDRDRTVELARYESELYDNEQTNDGTETVDDKDGHVFLEDQYAPPVLIHPNDGRHEQQYAKHGKYGTE